MDKPTSGTVVEGVEDLWVSIPLAEFESYRKTIRALQRRVDELEREVRRLYELRLRS